MKETKVNTAASLRNWSYVIITMPGLKSFPQDDQQFMLNQFRSTLQNMGMAADPPTRSSIIKIDGPNDASLEKQLSVCNPGNSRHARLLLVILPIKDTVLYNRIKYIGDVKLGIHTVCVVLEKLVKANETYFANVALKFNLKLGGINQIVDSTQLGIISEDKTMVVGIDVTHPSPASAKTAPSVAGMVASVDRWLGQWPATLRIQERSKEMVSELDSMLKSRLNCWMTLGNHKALPENLLIYRDGVSEGQYQTVIDKELPLLRNACVELYPAPDTKRGLPKITIVIVGKRHNTRFYPTTTQNADSSSNPENGTVVDRGVTEARNWDFFLQAHTALQGTARPAHYFVVLDQIFTKRTVSPPHQNTADVIESLTHSMCYMFGRATKAVSICPPAYYADLVCERARCYLGGIFEMVTPSNTPAQSVAGDEGPMEARAEDVVIHQNLKNTMFYI